MEISTVRDFVITIFFGLDIVLTIGIIVGLLVVYFKLRHLLISINNTLKSIHKCLAYIQGLAKGLNESMNFFKKGGG